MIGLTVMSASYLLIALAHRYEWLFPLRIVAAAAQAAYSTTSLALMGDLLERRPRQRGRDMGIYRGLGSLGFGLMAFVSGGLADRISLSFPFILSALFLGLAILLALAISEPALEDRPHGLAGWAQFARLMAVSLSLPGDRCFCLSGERRMLSRLIRDPGRCPSRRCCFRLWCGRWS